MSDVTLFVPGEALVVAYLDRVNAPIRVRNASQAPVVISRIDGCLRFRIDATRQEQLVSFEVSCGNANVPPSTEVEAWGHIQPHLNVPRDTVVFDLSLYYQAFCENQWHGMECVPHPSIGCVILRDRDQTNDQVFISHKDPQDTDLASLFRDQLQRVGLRGYIAECDPRYGTSIWQDKLPDAIRNSRLMAVLWTPRAAQSPDGIIREIRLARDLRVPVAVVQERGVDLPPGIDGDEERAFLELGSLGDSFGRFAEGLFHKVQEMHARP